MDNKAEVTTYFINDENMKNCPYIYIIIENRNEKWVIDKGSEVSLITEDLSAHLQNEGSEILELKLHSTVLVTGVWR